VAGLASVLNMAGSDDAVGCVWAAGCCVGRQHRVQADWMLRVAFPQLSGGVSSPRWAAWLCSRMMLLLPDV